MKTDSELQQDVIRELRWEPSIDAAHIGVEVKDSVVTLSGHVESFNEKWNAERVAKRVAGVKVLAVEIDVKLPGDTKLSDTDIANSIQHAMKWSAYALPESLQVKVDDGFVTLFGEVEWQFQRNAVANAVRLIKGVTGVRNLISIKPRVSMGAIKTDIEDALKRQALNDAQKIEVAVTGDQVTLRGDVHSWHERDLSVNAAWGVPGVRKVVDNLRIVY